MTTEFVEKLRKDATALYDSEVLINQRIESQCVKDMREAADMIEELSLKLHNSQMERSSQFYHSGWIPVSELLPKNSTRKSIELRDHHYSDPVIVTYLSLIDGTPNVSDYLAVYCDDGKWYWFDDLDALCVEVTGWMPLPEPYKSESEDK
jgi:hypothetical protein